VYRPNVYGSDLTPCDTEAPGPENSCPFTGEYSEHYLCVQPPDPSARAFCLSLPKFSEYVGMQAATANPVMQLHARCPSVPVALLFSKFADQHFLSDDFANIVRHVCHVCGDPELIGGWPRSRCVRWFMGPTTTTTSTTVTTTTITETQTSTLTFTRTTTTRTNTILPSKAAQEAAFILTLGTEAVDSIGSSAEETLERAEEGLAEEGLVKDYRQHGGVGGGRSAGAPAVDIGGVGNAEVYVIDATGTLALLVFLPCCCCFWCQGFSCRDCRLCCQRCRREVRSMLPTRLVDCMQALLILAIGESPAARRERERQEAIRTGSFVGDWSMLGQRVLITKTEIYWQDRHVSSIRRTGRQSFTVTDESGVSHSAQVVADGMELAWSNGSTWTRLRAPVDGEVDEEASPLLNTCGAEGA